MMVPMKIFTYGILFWLGLSLITACTSLSTAQHSTVKGSLPRLPSGLHYLILPHTKVHLVYYALSPELFIFCQLFPGPAKANRPGSEIIKPAVWQNQQLPLALAWKNGLHNPQQCYAQRIKQQEGNIALAEQVSNAPVILSCSNQQWQEYCLGALKALDQSNLSPREVEQMMCQRPYRCLWQGNQLMILL